jgi:hypothetical protein
MNFSLEGAAPSFDTHLSPGPANFYAQNEDYRAMMSWVALGAVSTG